MVFTVWSDEVRGQKYVLQPVAERRPREIPDSVERKLGAIESEKIARLVFADPTDQVFGVLCFAKDPHAEHRKRMTFDDRTVFLMKVEEKDGKLVAEIVERLDVSRLPSK